MKRVYWWGASGSNNSTGGLLFCLSLSLSLSVFCFFSFFSFLLFSEWSGAVLDQITSFLLPDIRCWMAEGIGGRSSHPSKGSHLFRCHDIPNPNIAQFATKLHCFQKRLPKNKLDFVELISGEDVSSLAWLDHGRQGGQARLALCREESKEGCKRNL